MIVQIIYSIAISSPINPAEPLPPLPAIPSGSLVIVESRAPGVGHGIVPSMIKLIEDPNHAATSTLYLMSTPEKLLRSLFFALFIVSIGRTIIR